MPSATAIRRVNTRFGRRGLIIWPWRSRGLCLCRFGCTVWKNAPPPGGHVFQPIGIIFEHVQDIIGMNLLTKFHEDQTINVACRVLTRFYYSHIHIKSKLT
ncbi:hypothetical protein DPMN_062568 [Dreissena polymorpha]|uniref:Uncharacterized protein n=1 Tax=Dreissena polymorpha TaxID=45954 RepID=A0A9D4C9V0_DREPO|nr:hypothetical protein DPMN_062568 [Dreissena polymorpha]